MNSKNCSTAALAVAAILVIGTLVAILPVGDADARNVQELQEILQRLEGKEEIIIRK